MRKNTTIKTTKNNVHLVALIIMDGWGHSLKKNSNAIRLAKTPNFDFFWKNYPHTLLDASGTSVGLPKNQIGGSEVGHMHLGAGRIVKQELCNINDSIKNKTFFENKQLLSAINHAKKHNTKLHLMGLLSNGGVHSDIKHLFALLELAKQQGIKKVFIHSFLDGRDTLPKSALKFIKQTQNKTKQLEIGKIASISGRYYAMDRDNRWNRTQKAFDSLVFGKGKTATTAVEAIKQAYDREETDEFILPTTIIENNQPISLIENSDSVVFFNFRADRARQLTHAFTDLKFNKFKTPQNKRPKTFFVCFEQYFKQYTGPVAFEKKSVSNTLSETISKNYLNQFHVAETEKYAHVTFFFNGGREKPFSGEDRAIVPSPKVATYDLLPEMNAKGVTDAFLNAIKSKKYSFLIANLANPDMVGHTGIMKAAIKAVETVDLCIGKMIKSITDAGGIAILTADHGNVENMIDQKTNTILTAHSMNPVPCILIGAEKIKLKKGTFGLENIAPTILELMNIEKPKEMTSKSLIKQNKIIK
ncbi:MAG: 2,3-bisphosphoglycerate-independent phosphoglycerate mutase [Candidatus Diapherotrites archaeon]|nr:2,3-bisphosphoglycerate-independent phosphoglycerate mutase [Candidatus Diapherotrites archaeon]